MKVAALLSAAAVAVAVPASGALASGESTPAPATAPTQAQQQPAPRDDSPRHDGDCPEKDGRGGSSSDTSVEL
jgi:hypothetical protein